MTIPCRLCTAFEQDHDALKGQLHTYIASLSSEQKVDDQLYQQRLEKCETCEAMHQGLCQYCGCFVIVRAVKKRMTCPNPTGRLW